MENLDQLKTDLLAQSETADLAALEDLRVSALGKSGTITEMVKGIGQVPPVSCTFRSPMGASVA